MVAKQATVHVKGADGVDVTLTPDAAAETSDRLLDAATHAQGQKMQEEERAVRRRDGPTA